MTPITPVFDVRTYVEEFEDAIVPAYLRGRADADWPADAGLARSIIPPGTATSRDFSHLAPQLPQFVAERCVGCMACVSACPDSALIARVVPEADVAPAVARFAAEQSDGGASATDLQAQFVRTKKYAEVPERNGIAPGAFGLFVEPTRCKGCGECVEVCAALGHDALFMTDKVDGEPDRASTIDRAATMVRFLRSLPPTPEVYRNEKALADLMFGRGRVRIRRWSRLLRRLRRGDRDPDDGGGDAPGVWPDVDGYRRGDRLQYRVRQHLSVQPVPRPVDELAVRECSGGRLRDPRDSGTRTGHAERRLWVMGGDGAMYDIGFQALSRMVASGADIKVLVLDTQVYSNTGGQASTASFGGQVTKLSAFGAAQHGRPEARKELGRILMAHGDVYVAQTTPAHVNHFYRSILEANEFPGPAVIISYAACMPEHGIADDAANRQARLAVDSRAFPLFTYDPRRGPRISDRLSLQGNPAIREDWSTTPAGEPIDFLSFARSEGRFAPHFGPSGEPTAEIQATNEDRLANWRTLQELAGVRPRV